MTAPPYTKQAANHPDLGSIGYWIFTGDLAWQFGKTRYAPGLVLPEGESPKSFSWPVRGHDVLIYCTSEPDEELHKQLAIELLRAKAKSVVAMWRGMCVTYKAENQNAK